MPGSRLHILSGRSSVRQLRVITGQQNPNDQPVLRWVVGIVNTLVIVGVTLFATLNGPPSEKNSIDVGSLAILAIQLLPTILFLAAVRSPRRTLIAGAILMTCTVAGGVFIILAETGEPLIGIYAVLAYFVALGTSMWAAISDSDYR